MSTATAAPAPSKMPLYEVAMPETEARQSRTQFGELLESAGTHVLRWGLVAILLYFGLLKFATFEAEGIRPFVENSPAMSWLYAIAGTQTVSNLIGATEIAIAVAIALRYVSPLVSGLGSLLAVGMFASTLSFLFTTPGVWGSVEGVILPVLEGPGGFLVKDLFLFGAAIFTAGEALRNSGE